MVMVSDRLTTGWSSRARWRPTMSQKLPPQISTCQDDRSSSRGDAVRSAVRAGRGQGVGRVVCPSTAVASHFIRNVGANSQIEVDDEVRGEGRGFGERVAEVVVTLFVDDVPTS